MFIYVPCGKYIMKAQVTAISQDGSAGDFSHHGTYTTPVDATAEIAKCHASLFGRTLADRMSYTHRQYATGCGQDDRTPDVCQMTRFREVGK